MEGRVIINREASVTPGTTSVSMFRATTDLIRTTQERQQRATREQRVRRTAQRVVEDTQVVRERRGHRGHNRQKPKRKDRRTP